MFGALRINLFGFLVSVLEILCSTEQIDVRVTLAAILLMRLALYKLGEHLMIVQARCKSQPAIALHRPRIHYSAISFLCCQGTIIFDNCPSWMSSILSREKNCGLKRRQAWAKRCHHILRALVLAVILRLITNAYCGVRLLDQLDISIEYSCRRHPTGLAFTQNSETTVRRSPAVRMKYSSATVIQIQDTGS